MSKFKCIDLKPHFNNLGIANVEELEKGTLTYGGTSLPSEDFPYNNIFNFGDIPLNYNKSNYLDNIELEGQTISFEETKINKIYIMGVSCLGNYFDNIYLLKSGEIISSNRLSLTDFMSEKPSFSNKCIHNFKRVRNRQNPKLSLQANIWLDEISLDNPLTIDSIRLEDNPLMHVFAITLQEA